MPGIHLLLKQERLTAWTCVLALFTSLQLHLAPCSEGKDHLLNSLCVLGNSIVPAPVPCVYSQSCGH